MQCLDFCAADFWSQLVYESAVEEPKHSLTCSFLHPLMIPSLSSSPEGLHGVWDVLVDLAEVLVEVAVDDGVGAGRAEGEDVARHVHRQAHTLVDQLGTVGGRKNLYFKDLFFTGWPHWNSFW